MLALCIISQCKEAIVLDETGLESFCAAVALLTEKFAMITFENRISFLDRDNVREVKEGGDDPNEVTLRPYERRAIIILMKRCLENSNIANALGAAPRANLVINPIVAEDGLQIWYPSILYWDTSSRLARILVYSN